MQKTNLYVGVSDGKVISDPQYLDVIPDVTCVDGGWYPVYRSTPETFNAELEEWESETFDIQEDKVVHIFTKKNREQKEIDIDANLKVIAKAKWWESVRIERNMLLTKCDWVITKCVEQGDTIPQQWIDYRQSLRDITNDTDFNGIFPAAPSV